MVETMIDDNGVKVEANTLLLAQDSGYNYSMWHYMNSEYFERIAGAWGGKGAGYTHEDITFRAKKPIKGVLIPSYNFGYSVHVYINDTLTITSNTSVAQKFPIELRAGDTLRIQHSGSYDRTEWFLLTNLDSNFDSDFVFANAYT